MEAFVMNLQPNQGTVINNMLSDYMTLASKRNAAAMDAFANSNRNVEGEIMATTLRGLLTKTTV